ncbi:MAG: hypothetical protein WBN17_02880 [Aureibaculum sp.]
MNISKFTSLLKYPSDVNVEQTNEIEEILNDYPYFQAARIIHLKGLKNQNSFKYNNALKTSAAYTSNRTVLFDFITADTLHAPESLTHEDQLIADSEIIDLEIVEETIDKDLSTTQERTEATSKILKEKLNIGKPLVFDVSEMHSFYQWLQLTSFKPVKREENKEIESSKEKEEKFDLIEQFIKSSTPKIKPQDATDKEIDISIESTKENENLMTETLARIYLEQKKYVKAIQAFKILSLKYPEKSSFFANRIKAIKFLQKNNS